ncbi:hypothetical protein THIOM_000733, partial [Candidatus Thiomargarita nelsonii]
MIHKSIKYIFWCILIYLPDSMAEIRLLEQNAQSVFLELTLPAPIISEKKLSGKTYQVIDIPGMAQSLEPGQSQIPTQATLIAVPRDSQIEIEMIESESKMLSNILLPPAP